MGTGYRPPSKEPQGRWARHIHAVRRERGWSAQRGFEAVHEALGLGPKSRAAYLPFESGERVPSPKEEAVLAEVYGWPPEAPTEPLDETPEGLIPAVVAAIDRQTAAIVAAIGARDQTLAALLQELREYRQQQGGLVETVVAALEQSGADSPGDDPVDVPRGDDPPGRRQGSVAGTRP